MKLLKSSIWSFLGVLIRGISSLTINKLFAVYFGPSEFGLFSHFQNLTTIFTTIPNDGINRGIIRYISPNNITTEEKRKYFSAGFYLNIFTFILTFVVVLVFPEYFLSKFKTSSALWIVIFAISILFLLFDYLLIAIILGFKNSKHFFILEFVGSIIFFIYLYIALTFYSVSIQVGLMHYMLALSLGFFVALAIILSQEKYKDVVSIQFPKLIHFKKINSFLIMAFVAVIFQKGIDFYIRELSFTAFGEVETGIWQSVVKISDYYMMAFTSVVMMAYYPQITSSLHNSRILKKVLFDGIKLYVPLILGGMIFIFITKEWMLELLFDKAFIDGSKFIHWQLLGDLLKMSAMLLGLLMLAESKIKWFVIGEFLSAFAYIFFINLMQDEQIDGLLKAHFYRYIIYFGYLAIYYRKILFS